VQAFSVAFDHSENDPESTGDEDHGETNRPSDYGSDVSMGSHGGYINVGKVPTTGAVRGTGRIVTFPNWIQVHASPSPARLRCLIPTTAPCRPRREHLH
jgi:hypothetical protein